MVTVCSNVMPCLVNALDDVGVFFSDPPQTEKSALQVVFGHHVQDETHAVVDAGFELTPRGGVGGFRVIQDVKPIFNIEGDELHQKNRLPLDLNARTSSLVGLEK